MQDIKKALSEMDGLDDDQWTKEGAPTIEFVSERVGRKVSRQEIVDAAPKFTRSNMVVDLEPEKEDEENAVQEEEGQEEVSGTPMIDRYLAEGPMQIGDFLDLLRQVPDNQLAVMETMLIEQMAHVEKSMSELDEMKRLIKFALANTRADIKNRTPQMSNMDAIRAYIDNQTATRAERFQHAKDVLGGLTKRDLARLDPRAPIDRAMARKTARGAARPTR
jgi:hypothetical protein